MGYVNALEWLFLCLPVGYVNALKWLCSYVYQRGMHMLKQSGSYKMSTYGEGQRFKQAVLTKCLPTGNVSELKRLFLKNEYLQGTSMHALK